MGHRLKRNGARLNTVVVLVEVGAIETLALQISPLALQISPLALQIQSLLINPMIFAPNIKYFINRVGAFNLNPLIPTLEIGR